LGFGPDFGLMAASPLSFVIFFKTAGNIVQAGITQLFTNISYAKLTNRMHAAVIN